MLRVIALYPHPDDPDAFMEYFERTHIPLMREVPGLLDLRYGRAKPIGAGQAPYFLVGEMDFADEASFFAALSSEEGQRGVADIPNYSPKGVTLQYIEL